MSQNSPFWRDQGEGCPAATLRPPTYANMTPLPASLPASATWSTQRD